jgi:hypothetical protein
MADKKSGGGKKKRSGTKSAAAKEEAERKLKAFDFRCWCGLSKQLPDIPKVILESRWRPPQGEGHFDRFVFSNGTTDHTVMFMSGAIHNAIPDIDPQHLYPFSIDVIPPMTVGVLHAPLDSPKSQRVTLNALVQNGGQAQLYTFRFDPVEPPPEYVIALCCGILEVCDGAELQVHPYALAIGSEGGQYLVPPENIEVQEQ